MRSHRRSISRTSSLAALIALGALTQFSGAEPVASDLAGPHIISQAQGESLIARYRATAAPSAVRSQHFDRSAFDALLGQPGATGIRVHYAAYADGTPTLVLYATDKTGRQLPMAANFSHPCPGTCESDDPDEGK